MDHAFVSKTIKHNKNVLCLMVLLTDVMFNGLTYRFEISLMKTIKHNKI